MSFTYARTTPVDEKELATILQQVDRFREKWSSTPSLISCSGVFRNDGSVDNVANLNYVIYEGLHEMFVSSGDEFFTLGAAILGQTLVKQLKFEWCTIQIGSKSIMGLKSEYNNMIVPIYEMIIHRLSTFPQFGTFEYIFFDIYEATYIWPDGCHPLVDATELEKDQFKEIYDYIIPDDIVVELAYLTFDKEWIRELGSTGYELAEK